MKPIALHGEMVADPGAINIRDVGKWRETRHFMSGLQSTIEMPNPFNMPKLLHAWWADLVDFHNQMKKKIEMPHLLEDDDIRLLVEKAYDTNLKICCIKPFTDGSNRIARLTENLLRLNWGLPWKTIPSEDEHKLAYLDDIKKMQTNYPAN